MFNPFERMMAGRYLRARKAEGFVSVIAAFSFLGILIGVATLIIVMSVMNGFRAELVGRILGLNGHLNIYSQSGGPMPDYDGVLERVKLVNGVVEARPFVEGQVLVQVGGNASGAMVRGMRAEDFQNKKILSDSIVNGSVRDFSGQSVAIGNEMARRLNLQIGSSITVMAPKGKATPFGTIPRSGQYTVGAIFDVGMYEYNNGYIFMPLEAAQAFFMMPEAVTAIEIMAESPMRVDGVKQTLQQVVGDYAQVYDWRDANKLFLNTLAVERNVMFIILTLIIIVATFNIISSMIMLVKDKGRDIAILRTMGATQGMIMRIFILTGASIGLAGTAFGAAFGIVFALNIESIRQWLQNLIGMELFADEIYFLSQLPAIVEWPEVITVVSMALGLSIAATIYPAWRASRLDPVEALRYE